MASPLHIVILHHAESTRAAKLAGDLLVALYGPPAMLELRIPTFFGPVSDGAPPPLEPLFKSGAAAVLLVYLLDERMNRRVEGGTGAAWSKHLEEALAAAVQDPKHRSVVPLVLDDDGFKLMAARLHRNARRLPESWLDSALQHIAVRALHLLSGKEASPEEGQLQVPIQIFLSHAKADLKSGVATDPVKSIDAELTQHAVERFFDSSRIGPGENFATRLEKEAHDSDVMVVVWTDQWSGRPWCQRELLTAKRGRGSVVIVDALDHGAVRAFPYIGNATWIRWRAPLPPSDTHVPKPEELDAARVERARVWTRIVLAALRTRYERCALGPSSEPHVAHIGSAPEALDVAENPSVREFVYPDPPVPDDERRVLEQLSARKLTTPLSRIAGAKLQPRFGSVVVSVSSPGDAALRALGLAPWHLDTVTDELHLGVLVAGMRIVYGGVLNHQSAGSTNFMRRLLSIVQRYGALAQQLGVPWLQPVVNTPPWPLHLSYGEAELSQFGDLADLARGPTPDLGTLAYQPFERGKFPPIDSVERLLAAGLGLQAMRKETTLEGRRPRPRILVGGPEAASIGWLPGIVEEACCSLEIGAPLYLLGGFGGAAAVVARLLTRKDDATMTDAEARRVVTIQRVGNKVATVEENGQSVAVYDAALRKATSLGLPFATRDAVAAKIRGAGTKGLAGALANGLGTEDNEELLEARDSRRILELIVKGLAALKAG